MTRAALPILVLTLLLAPPAGAGETPPQVQPLVKPLIRDGWVTEALEAAGPNRAELEKVLAHFAKEPRKLTAARFLIANMPGKGYISTELRDKAGNVIPFDPLGYANFKEALAAFDALTAKHGEIDFARDKKIEDLKTVKASFLIKHIDLSFAAWQKTPTDARVGFEAFLNFVLPYRGSQEPVDAWLEPLMQRYAGRVKALEDEKLTAQELYAWLSKDIHKRLRFNERFYLHPTDQSFTEMGRTGQGRCEDITNMITFAARSLALATAADYTPYWAHRDNNHAWNVLLDKDGRGYDKGQSHAAKIYRKTFAIQRDSLAFDLPKGREAPNRFMASTTSLDVTDQYMPTSTAAAVLDEGRVRNERHAYLCVFNGGEWRPVAWAKIDHAPEFSHAAFEHVGRGIVYLVAIHDGKRLVPAADPFLVLDDGTRTSLAGKEAGVGAIAIAVSPKKVSPDTFAETPVNYLKDGAGYVLKRWDAKAGDWVDVRKVTGAKAAPRFYDLPRDSLYWLVPDDDKPRRDERPWTIGPKGFQRWW